MTTFLTTTFLTTTFLWLLVTNDYSSSLITSLLSRIWTYVASHRQVAWCHLLRALGPPPPISDSPPTPLLCHLLFLNSIPHPLPSPTYLHPTLFRCRTPIFISSYLVNIYLAPPIGLCGHCWERLATPTELYKQSVSVISIKSVRW